MNKNEFTKQINRLENTGIAIGLLGFLGVTASGIALFVCNTRWALVSLCGLAVSIGLLLDSYSYIWKKAKILKERNSLCLGQDTYLSAIGLVKDHWVENKKILYNAKEVDEQANSIQQNSLALRLGAKKFKRKLANHADKLLCKYETKLAAKKREGYSLPYITDENFYNILTKYTEKELKKQAEIYPPQFKLYSLIEDEIKKQKFLIAQRKQETR